MTLGRLAWATLLAAWVESAAPRLPPTGFRAAAVGADGVTLALDLAPGAWLKCACAVEGCAIGSGSRAGVVFAVGSAAVTLSMFAAADAEIGRDRALAADGVDFAGDSAALTLSTFATAGAETGGGGALARDGAAFTGGPVTVALGMPSVAGAGIDVVFTGEGAEAGAAAIAVLVSGFDD